MPESIVVFIIDDDPDDQDLLIEALMSIDPSIECFTALNGQEALTKLETRALPYPSLIFLDLNMPRVDGRRCLHELKKNPKFKSIPVVIYTTSSEEKDKDDMKQLGAMDYMVKQFNFSLLKKQLRQILPLIMTT